MRRENRVALTRINRLLRRSSHLVWDFDGVVSDTEPAQGRSYAQVLAELGAQLDIATDFAGLMGESETVIWDSLRAQFGIRIAREQLSRRRRELYSATLQTLRLAWYVRPILTMARSLSRPVLIVSSGGIDNIARLLEAWSVADCFDFLICAGSPGFERLPDKNARIRYVARRFGPHAIAIEDSGRYLRLWKRYGASVVGVQHSLNRLPRSGLDSVLMIERRHR